MSSERDLFPPLKPQPDDWREFWFGNSSELREIIDRERREREQQEAAQKLRREYDLQKAGLLKRN